MLFYLSLQISGLILGVLLTDGKCSDDECLTLPKKKVAHPKKTNTQKFRTEWLSDSTIKAWLVAPRPESSNASSKFCQKNVSCSKTSHADLEWRQQAVEEGTDFLPDQTATAFWRNWLEANMLSGRYKYPNLRKVVAMVFYLPFSNACVEHLFSSLKLLKTFVRSSLKHEALVGVVHTNQGMTEIGIHAHQIKQDDVLLELVQKVKSSATNSQAHESNNKELCRVSEN